MSLVTEIFLAILALLLPALAYLWYVTPDPRDLANEVLSRSKRTRNTGSGFARRPQANVTHVNCLS
jgi:hypothetical protein